jgi:DNA-binding NarL/FixJ family response regulator
MKRTRVLIADDHPFTLEGLRAFRAPNVEVIGTVMNGTTLVDEALRLKPELIILDITMPLLNGIDAAIQIKKHLSNVKLVFVTMHASPAYFEAALEAGAIGYVLKSAAREELLNAIERVIAGQIYVTPSLSGEDLSRFSDPQHAAATLRLSAREREILQLIAEGKANKEIAFLLSISIKTGHFTGKMLRESLVCGVRLN